MIFASNIDGRKSVFILNIPNEKIIAIIWHSRPINLGGRLNRFGRKTALCMWWDWIDCELVKPLETVKLIASNNKWSIWTAHWSKNVHNMLKDMIRWFYSMSTCQTIREGSKSLRQWILSQPLHGALQSSWGSYTYCFEI